MLPAGYRTRYDIRISEVFEIVLDTHGEDMISCRTRTAAVILSIGLACGLAVGAGIGLLMAHPALGIGIGLSMGGGAAGVLAALVYGGDL